MWRETRVWCTDCGRHRLLTRREPAPGAVRYRCPGCNPSANAPGAELRLANPFFAGLVGDLVRPAAIIGRVAEWSSRYYAGGAGAGEVACTRCGAGVTLRSYVREGTRPSGGHSHGLFAACEACGEQVSSSVGGLALAVPEVRRFRRDHPRTRARLERGLEHEGVPALAMRYESLRGSAGVAVVFSAETLRVLDVHGETA